METGQAFGSRSGVDLPRESKWSGCGFFYSRDVACLACGADVRASGEAGGSVGECALNRIRGFDSLFSLGSPSAESRDVARRRGLAEERLPLLADERGTHGRGNR